MADEKSAERTQFGRGDAASYRETVKVENERGVFDVDEPVGNCSPSRPVDGYRRSGHFF